MKRRGMGTYFNYFVLVLSLYVSMSSISCFFENLIEADEIEIVDKGEINQRRNSCERCGISAIIAAHVMENGSKCTEIGKTFGYN